MSIFSSNNKISTCLWCACTLQQGLADGLFRDTKANTYAELDLTKTNKQKKAILALWCENTTISSVVYDHPSISEKEQQYLGHVCWFVLKGWANRGLAGRQFQDGLSLCIMVKKCHLLQLVLTPGLEGCLWLQFFGWALLCPSRPVKIHEVLSQASDVLSDALVSLQPQQNLPYCHCFLLKTHSMRRLQLPPHKIWLAHGTPTPGCFSRALNWYCQTEEQDR